MPLAAWQIKDDGPQRLSMGALALEKDFEEWIEKDPRLLDAGLTVIARQLNVAGVGKIDLLCVDPQGRATVVEIKRGQLSRETIAQALDYASAVAVLPAASLQERIVQYLGAEETARNASVSSSIARLHGSSWQVGPSRTRCTGCSKRLCPRATANPRRKRGSRPGAKPTTSMTGAWIRTS